MDEECSLQPRWGPASAPPSALRGLRAPCPSTWTPRMFYFASLSFVPVTHGPPKGRPPPIMLCVSARDVHVHGDFLAVILHVSGRIRLPACQGPGSGLPCTRPDALCGFLVTCQQCPTSPQEKTHMWPWSDASWVVLRRTPTLRAEAAPPSDRRSAAPGQCLAAACGSR